MYIQKGLEKYLAKLLSLSLLTALSACDSSPPLVNFTLPASQMLTTENHTSDYDGGFLGLCIPKGGTGSTGRIHKLAKNEIMVGWDRMYNADDCDTTVVDWYRGAVLFNLNDLNHALKGKDPVSVELLFQANGTAFEHRNGETVGVSTGKNMLCAQQIEIAIDPWPQWTPGTHDTIKGDGDFIPLEEGEMRNLSQNGVRETTSGYFRVEVTNAFRQWRSGNIANFGFMIRSNHESSAKDVRANDGCLTHFTNFAIRVVAPDPNAK